MSCVASVEFARGRPTTATSNHLVVRLSATSSASVPSVAMSSKSSPPSPSRLSFPVVLTSAFCVLLALTPLVLHPTIRSPAVLLRSSSAPRTDANIAYFIQVTPATISHLPRLYRTLHHPLNTHALHFDVKIPEKVRQNCIRQLRAYNPYFERDTVIIPSRKIVYNGISMVLNTLHAMSELLPRPDWDFFINLSGHDYPLYSVKVQRKLLGSVMTHHPIFLNVGDIKSASSVFRGRASNIVIDPTLCFPANAPHRDNPHPKCNQLQNTFTKNPSFDPSFDFSFEPQYSGAWLIAPRRFCLNATISSEARHLLVAFANMRGSDEFFFSTLIAYNPVFNHSVIRNALREVLWVVDGKRAGQHPYFVDQRLNGSYRFVQTLNSSLKFFARKFATPNSEIMDIVDRMSTDTNRERLVTKWFASLTSKFSK